jgi:hypothetical protein
MLFHNITQQAFVQGIKELRNACKCVSVGQRISNESVAHVFSHRIIIFSLRISFACSFSDSKDECTYSHPGHQF